MPMWKLFADGGAYDDRWPDDFEKWKVERSARRANLAGTRAAVAAVPDNGAIGVISTPN
jgi:hypothetical protein